MASKTSAKILVDQKQALNLFLDSLLRETETMPAAPEVKTEVEAEVEESVEVQVAPESVVPETVELESVPQESIAEESVAVETVIVEPAPIQEAPVLVEPEVEPEVATPQEMAAAEPAADFSVPEWANEPFQVMLFKAGGLTLAVPLGELSGVIEWPEKIAEMPGHADFYLGLVSHLERQVPVVDTARLVLPEDHLERLPEDVEERVTRIVLIDEASWGLACDSVAEVVTLEPDAVRWRGHRAHHPWLAGTVVEHMCALIDGSEFARRLRAGKS